MESFYLKKKHKFSYLESRYKIMTLITLHGEAVCGNTITWLFLFLEIFIYLRLASNTQEPSCLYKTTRNWCDYSRHGRPIIMSISVNIDLTQIYQVSVIHEAGKNDPHCNGKFSVNKSFQLSMHETEFCATVEKLYNSFFSLRNILL